MSALSRILLLILAIASFSLGAYASGPPKIGIVDMQKAFFQSQAALEYMDKSKKVYQPKLDALSAERDQIQSAEAKLKKNALTLSKQEFDKRQGKLENEKKDFLEQLQKIRQEKNTADLNEFKRLEPQLKQAIQDVAEKGKYSIVLDQAVVLYQNGDANMTHSVIKEMNRLSEQANKEGKKQ